MKNDALLCNRPCGLHKEGQYTGVQYLLVFCQQTTLLLGSGSEWVVDRLVLLPTYSQPLAYSNIRPALMSINDSAKGLRFHKNRWGTK